MSPSPSFACDLVVQWSVRRHSARAGVLAAVAGALAVVVAALTASLAPSQPLAAAEPAANSAAASPELVLSAAGASAYRIVVADDASPSTRYAAEELQRFLAEIGGAKLPIVSDAAPGIDTEIVVGANRRLAEIGVELDGKRLGREGYRILAVGKRLVVAGGEPRGTLYGVYGLLEEHLGCRWFAPDVSRIPKKDRIVLGAIDETRVPALEYREPYTFDAFDGDWCARNRVNSAAGRLEARHGGKVRFGSGFFVHTFDRLVPPEKYFDAHPEYFSLVNGKRLKERSQLCCTNEDVIRLCTEGILAAMAAQPDATVFSVSQNDWYNQCQCENCQKLAEAEESQIAPVLQLVNRVAEAVARQYPDKAVETLAYQWTRKPPKTLRPRPNVIVRLCSIECCFSHPLATCDSEANRRFREDAEAWSKTGARLWVWDYVTDFRHYLLPFPNQRVRKANIQFYVRHGVTGIFEQDTYNTPHSELAALGAYLTAKFLWNPDYDEQTALGEFLEGYYGAAAGPIRTYLDRLHDRAEKENIHVNIWAGPESAHLTDALLLEADGLWQQAEDAVAGDADVLRRVRQGRMSVDYAMLERARLQSQGKLPRNAELRATAARRFETFIETVRAAGVTRFNEWQALDLDAYREGVKAFLDVPAAP